MKMRVWLKKENQSKQKRKEKKKGIEVVCLAFKNDRAGTFAKLD